ncbi:unnamed protein product [Closterium sp. Naga37s-1]|nr:unnamed protein product [Closterium sp. Naga37s-1]
MPARSVTQSTSPERKHQRASSVRFAGDDAVEPGGSGDGGGGGGSGGGGGGGGGGGRDGGSTRVGDLLSADDASSEGISLESSSRAGSQREREEWQLDYSQFEAARRDLNDSHGRLRILKRLGGRNPVDGYYRQQNEMIDGFSEMDALSEQLLPPTPSEVREARRLHRSEFMAVQISNGANVCLFIVKIIASIVSGSLAILASTLDSLLDLLCGFILWYTARTMRCTNPYKYPIGKRRMQPLGIIVFACIMASLGFQILLEGVRKLTDSSHSAGLGEKWGVYVGIMGLVILTKFILFLYCRLFSDDIVQAYALDHMMDVVTNTVGLAAAVLAGEYAWWIDPVGAIFVRPSCSLTSPLLNSLSLKRLTSEPCMQQQCSAGTGREVCLVDRLDPFGAIFVRRLSPLLPSPSYSFHWGASKVALAAAVLALAGKYAWWIDSTPSVPSSYVPPTTTVLHSSYAP